MGKLLMSIVRYHGVERFNVLDVFGIAWCASSISRGEYKAAALYFFGFFVAGLFASVVVKLSNPDPRTSSR